jgi:Uma2 family endonuclease
MAEVGLLDGESEVELIEGEIIHVSPMGTRDRQVVERLRAVLQSAVAGRAVVDIRRAMRLGNLTETQPALVVRKPGRDPRSGFATGNDTLLLVEVSGTTALYDHDIKLPIYATHGIPEVWIVDLQSHQVYFYRSLVQDRYTEVQICGNPGLTRITSYADVDIDLSGLPI